jgi:hypothetical protein
MIESLRVERCYWTTKEAAAYIGVHTETLRAYCRGRTNGGKAAKRVRVQQRIPPFIILGARSYRFPIGAFKTWAEQGNLGPTRR